ncbi:hypothetical protein CKAH01_16657 [Colletotrichum kahawae]|uniref:Heterokaryon incompatibility domain-containing protein n=1 Tax=Colletotrichum kahawae TaxID=34407 RepID=A0AAE0D550_COLKA|nr:hypothetical protein CKAH01_16657 [Colletotrichum kahawae]
MSYYSRLTPKYLCLVKDFQEGTYETINVSEYLAENGDDIDLEFVFVSYTRMHFRVATNEEISSYDYPDERTREANRELARNDREILAKWGIDAARRVRKRAFWLDFECVRNDDGIARSTSSSEDVYKICDIVQAAHSMIIAIGPTASEKVASLMAGEQSPTYHREQVTPWLRQWGSRLWTLPQLLLCPAEYRIRLYVSGDSSEPKAMAKRNFADRAWNDAEAVKELVNHFEGSAILTSSNLIEAALRCFATRQTDQFSQGDIAYAIMGLFPSRLRPHVKKEDTGFQAFAKLSLANDSGAFLDRLICLSPPANAPWYDTQDQWGVILGEMQPLARVRAVLESDTVILEGVHGATIQWETIDPEPYGDRTMGQFQNSVLLYSFFFCTINPVTIMIFLFGSSLMDFSGGETGMPERMLPAGVILLIGAFALVLPVMLIRSRRQAKRPFIPRLIGIEGLMDAGTVETYMWGSNHGNLTDVTSQAYTDDLERAPENQSTPQPENSFLFTLVDTHVLTVSHVRCTTPPLAMFVCGQENEMHRTMLCSYDWKTQTYHRQAVLRSHRRKLDEMRLNDRIRFSLASHPTAPRDSETQPGSVPSSTSGLSNAKTKVASLSINLFQTYEFEDQPHDLVNYKLCFVVGQILSITILSKLPTNQVFPYAFLAKIYLYEMEAIYRDPLPGLILQGLLDGWLASVILVLILA